MDLSLWWSVTGRCNCEIFHHVRRPVSTHSVLNYSPSLTCLFAFSDLITTTHSRSHQHTEASTHSQHLITTPTNPRQLPIHRVVAEVFISVTRQHSGSSPCSVQGQFLVSAAATMPYVDTWDEFAEEAQRILSAAPSKARLLTTFRHKEKALVVKATDDIEVGRIPTRLPAAHKQQQQLP